MANVGTGRKRILGLSGSLRAKSGSTALLRLCREYFSKAMDIEIYDGIGSLPHFNPDLEEAGTDFEVSKFRRLVAEADALLIASPEYAHGIPGSLKNALDWLVGSQNFHGKPVGLLSSISQFAKRRWIEQALMETLKVMGAKLPRQARLNLPEAFSCLQAGKALGEASMKSLEGALKALLSPSEISAGRKGSWSVYVLECDDGSFYTGISIDPQKRFLSHQKGRGARYTKLHPPLRILSVETLGNYSLASQREYQIKQLSKNEKRIYVSNPSSLADLKRGKGQRH